MLDVVGDVGEDGAARSLDLLRGLDVLVLDCLRLVPHPTHLWLERSLEYVSELRPRRVLHRRRSGRSAR